MAEVVNLLPELIERAGGASAYRERIVKARKSFVGKPKVRPLFRMFPFLKRFVRPGDEYEDQADKLLRSELDESEGVVDALRVAGIYRVYPGEQADLLSQN